MKMKGPLEVKRSLMMRLKTFELVSESLRVKNGQCVTRCVMGNEMVFSSTWSMSSLCSQRVFLP